MFKIRVLMVSILIFVTNSLTHAADVIETGLQPTTIDKCSLKIFGEIHSGDASKVEIILNRLSQQLTDYAYKTDFAGLDYVVCLSGSGGDYQEAVKIAEMFVQKFIATSVPSGETCKEACAIVFMGGRDCCVEAGNALTKRHLAAGSRLGLAAPKFDVGTETLTSKETAAAFQKSIDVISDLQNKADILDISNKIINHIISNRNGNVFFIEPNSALTNNFVDSNGDVFQDIWVPGISGVVQQGTQDQ